MGSWQVDSEASDEGPVKTVIVARKKTSCGADDRKSRNRENVHHRSEAPFIHPFKTDKSNFIYDVNTRRIIRVGAAVWDIIEDYGSLDVSSIATKHSSKHSRSEVREAFRRISKARKEGLFLSNRPLTVMALGRDKVQRELAEWRGQLILNVTEDCNFRCSYCAYGGKYQYNRTHSPRKMPWTIAKSAIEDYLAHSAKSKDRVISFYGGEPLLNLQLIRKCVDFVRGKDDFVRFGLTTNGSLLQGDAAQFIGDHNFAVVISLDGPSDAHDLHRRTKKGQPTWRQIVANVRQFLAAHPKYATNNRLRFNAVIDDTTDLCRLQEFFSSFDLFTDSMGVELNQKKDEADVLGAKSSNMLANTARVLYDEFQEALVKGDFGRSPNCRAEWVMASLFQKPFVNFHKRGYLSPHLPEEMRFLNTCIPGVRRTFVSVQGDYFACERVVASDATCIGDVNRGVDVDRVMSLIDQWVCNRDDCRCCWCLPTCHVGCFATVGQDGRITSKDKKAACAQYQAHAHRELMEYCRILERNPKAFDFTANIEIS